MVRALEKKVPGLLPPPLKTIEYHLNEKRSVRVKGQRLVGE